MCFSEKGGYFGLGGLNYSKHMKKAWGIKIPYDNIKNRYALKVYDVLVGDKKLSKQEKKNVGDFNSRNFIINTSSE